MDTFIFVLLFFGPIMLGVVYLIYVSIYKVKNTITYDSFVVENSLLMLAAKIIKADGEVSKVELKKITTYIDKNHYKRRAAKHHINFKKYLNTNIDIKRAVKRMDYEDVTHYQKNTRGARGSLTSTAVKSSTHRIKWLHFLISIAVCDRVMSTKEYAVLNDIRIALKLHNNTFQSILALHNYITEEELNRQQTVKQYSSNNVVRSYSVLGLTKNATVKEIKEAYRNMMKLYHPDKQIGRTPTMDDKKRYQQVQDAYEVIKQHKGIK